jgi:crotonobetainyl-CoA:carnitine CoA-transferase CaiB-like acyl-CoA transferase
VTAERSTPNDKADDDGRALRKPPLDGVLVADFSRVLAGPLATMFLGDLGATVVKVERPGAGDETRSWGPPYVGSMSTYFSSVNRDKRSVTLDLSDPADRVLARRLADRADVLIENLRQGRLSDFGLDYASLAESNPGLVYCSISGFGSRPEADRPGYDFVVQALGGLMSLTGPAEGEASKVGVAVVDVFTGLHAVIGILAALREREVSGQGQLVEVNLLASLLGSLVNQSAAYLNGAGSPERLGNRHPSIAPYETLASTVNSSVCWRRRSAGTR